MAPPDSTPEGRSRPDPLADGATDPEAADGPFRARGDAVGPVEAGREIEAGAAPPLVPLVSMTTSPPARGAGWSRLRSEAGARGDADLLPEGSTVPSTVAVAVPTEGARLQAVRLAAAPPEPIRPRDRGQLLEEIDPGHPPALLGARLDRRPGSPRAERADIGTVAGRHHQADADAGGAESVAAPLVTEARRRAAGPP